MASQYVDLPFGTGVTSLNGLTGALSLVAGSNITITPSGSNITIAATGVASSIGAFGSTPNANGLSLTGSVLNMQPADATRPGGVSITTQTFAGQKKFATSPAFLGYTQYAIPFIGAPSGGDITQDPNFLNYNNSLRRFGVQVDPLSTRAAIHSNSAIGSTITVISGLGVTYVDLSPVAAPTAPSTVQLDLASLAGTLAASQNGGGGGYIANGSTYTYNFYTLATDTVHFTPTFSQIIFTDDNSGNPFQVDLTWGSYTGASVIILLDIDGGGFNVARVVPNGAFATSDDNDFSDPVVITPALTNAYVASGLDHGYNMSLVLTDPNGLTYYSTDVAYSFMDNFNGAYYQVTHTLAGSGNYKVAGSNFIITGHFFNTSIFNEGPEDITGDNILTPTTIGYASDGLTRDYQVYEASLIGGVTYYSNAPALISFTDPGTFLFYGILLNWAGISSGDTVKILRQVSSGGYNEAYVTVANATQFEDNATVSFSGDTSVTPSLVLPPAIRAEANFSTPLASLSRPALPPQMEIYSTAVSDAYSRINFLDAAGNLFGAVQGDTQGMRVVRDTNSFFMSTTLAAVNSSLNVNGNINANGILGCTGVSAIGNFFTSGDMTATGDLAGGRVLATTSLNAVGGMTFLNGSTSGTAQYAQPLRGNSYKKFIFHYSAFTDAGRTFVFPTPFANTPYKYGDAAALAVTTVSASNFTIAACVNITGTVFVEGF